MLKKRFTLLITLGLATISAVIVLFVMTLTNPSADIATDGLPSVSAATIWGTVRFADTNQPAANMKVIVGGVVATTDNQGRYVISIHEEGDIPVVFENIQTKQLYELASGYEQAVHASFGETEEQNFLIRRVTL